MGYDKSKDKILKSKEVYSESGKGGFDVMIVQYDDGDMKVQFQPFYMNDQNEKKYVKFSRIKLSFFPEIIKAVQELESQI